MSTPDLATHLTNEPRDRLHGFILACVRDPYLAPASCDLKTG